MKWLPVLSLFLAACTINGRRVVQDESDEGPWIPGKDFAIIQGDQEYPRGRAEKNAPDYDYHLAVELKEKLSPAP